jgi:hypothetical protein
MQAQFICLAQNLMLLFDRCLEQNGIENTKENARRKDRLDKALKNVSGINQNWFIPRKVLQCGIASTPIRVFQPFAIFFYATLAIITPKGKGLRALKSYIPRFTRTGHNV